MSNSISHFAPHYNSAIEGIDWPAVTNPEAANSAAVLYQLEKSQWWAHEEMLSVQLNQLSLLISHAIQTVPFYSQRYFEQADLIPTKPFALEQWHAEYSNDNASQWFGGVGGGHSRAGRGRPGQLLA